MKKKRREKHVKVLPFEHMRHIGIFNPLEHQPRVTVVGAGGIGGAVIPALVKLGIKRITVLDHDRVEVHNLSTTPYSPKDIGKPKVKAMAEICQKLGVKINAIPRKFTGEKLPPTDVLISGVDSMDARRRLFKYAVDHKVPFFLDGRTGGTKLRVYAIRPNKSKDRAYYRSTLVSADRIVPLPCMATQIWDINSFIAGFMIRAFRRWLSHGTLETELIFQSDDLLLEFSPPVRTRTIKSDREITVETEEPKPPFREVVFEQPPIEVTNLKSLSVKRTSSVNMINR